MGSVADRDYDVLLYGAGGFTGRQTVAYFAAHAPPGLRWAIAGPRRHTLEAARAAAGAPISEGDIHVAPSEDQSAVDAVIRRACVVLSTAGPFGLYGKPIVDACVRFGTHYVDITGETPWMREIAATYHERAAAQGTRIIPACGFDSIPSDLGALLMSRAVRDSHGVACREVRAYFQFSGGINGGTVASLLNMLKAPRSSSGATAKSAAEGRIRLVKGPQYDPEIGTWIGPFVMAPTNTHVVRRSLALAEASQQPYGPGFTYQEAMKFDPPMARVRATASTAGLGLLFVGLRLPATRALLERILPKPGTGPPVKTMDAGWFTCDLLGIAEDGRTMRGLIRYDGDPGNRATTVFVCESALAVALDGDGLPGGRSRGGVLTPATGLGDALVERLRRAGTVIHMQR